MSVVITSIVIATNFAVSIEIVIMTTSTSSTMANSFIGGSAFNSVIKMVYTPLIILVCIISVATIGSPTIKVPVGFTDFAGWTG